MNLEVDERKLIEHLQDGDIGHQDLYRRARRIHERELARVVHDTMAVIGEGTAARASVARPPSCSTPACRRSRTRPRPRSSGARS